MNDYSNVGIAELAKLKTLFQKIVFSSSKFLPCAFCFIGSHGKREERREVSMLCTKKCFNGSLQNGNRFQTLSRLALSMLLLAALRAVSRSRIEKYRASNQGDSDRPLRASSEK